MSLMKRISILGARGMLGQDLMSAGNRTGLEVRGYDLPEIDVTDATHGLDALETCDAIINCAAYTDVDGAETDFDAAMKVNCAGAANVAEWCRKNSVQLIHLSTDYIFDGSSRRPYREDDPANPVNKYGESKLAGEKTVSSICDKYIIVRTQSLFGHHGKNFVGTIVNLCRNSGKPLRVVNDQVSAPTYTPHLAEGILRLLNSKGHGIIHVSAAGSTTWHDFARAIALSVAPETRILKTTTEEYGAMARRPSYSILDNSRYNKWTGHRLPGWQEGLKDYMQKEGF